MTSVSSNLKVPCKLYGFTLQTYWYQEFQNQAQVIAALTAMKSDLGANFVQIGYVHYSPTDTSNIIANSADIVAGNVPVGLVQSQKQMSATINGVSGTYYPFQLNSPESADVAWVIQKAVSMGFVVSVKPQVDVSGGNPWRALIKPTNPGAPGVAGSWFDSYNTFIVAQAKLAQAAGATYFSVGNENVSMAQAQYDNQWKTIIANVRAVFSGKLTYASAGFGSPSETMATGMWEYLDYAGIDLYPELLPMSVIPTTTTPLSEVVAGFANNYAGIDYLTQMKAFMTKANKPVIITETGTMNWNGGCSQPWNSGGNDTVNDAAQTLYWQALLQWLYDNSATIPIEGIAGWMWRPSNTDAGAAGYSIWNRPALAAVSEWFNGKASAPQSPSTSSTSVASSSTTPSTTTAAATTAVPATPPMPKGSISKSPGFLLAGYYEYQIVSVNAAGHSAPSPIFGATVPGNSSEDLSWPVDQNATHTEVYRYGYLLATVTGGSYTDIGDKGTNIKVPVSSSSLTASTSQPASKQSYSLDVGVSVDGGKTYETFTPTGTLSSASELDVTIKLKPAVS
jgi:hypothetical protein